MSWRVLTLSLLLLLVAAGCGENSVHSRVTTVLFDLSGSTSPQAIRQQYLKDFSKILNQVANGGVIAADIIDDNPVAHSTFPINESFDRYEPMKENKLDYERRIKQQRDTVLKEADAIMRKRAAPATDVIDAMQLAERVFSTYEGNQKLLVVFSDMIEESRRYNFTTEKLTAARIGQIIANEQDAGRLPDLQGVEVCVVGAGATTSGGLPADKLVAIAMSMAASSSSSRPSSRKRTTASSGPASSTSPAPASNIRVLSDPSWSMSNPCAACFTVMARTPPSFRRRSSPVITVVFPPPELPTIPTTSGAGLACGTTNASRSSWWSSRRAGTLDPARSRGVPGRNRSRPLARIIPPRIPSAFSVSSRADRRPWPLSSTRAHSARNRSAGRSRSASSLTGTTGLTNDVRPLSRHSSGRARRW